MTSERTLVRLTGGEAATSALVTPKGDGLLLGRADGTLSRYALQNPHPEITWRTLFGKVWYEGYGRPEYVWQSTGATNDFETKFSLVPLVFGTLKGTFYAQIGRASCRERGWVADEDGQSTTVIEESGVHRSTEIR